MEQNKQDRFLSISDVRLITGLSRTTIWRMENDGTFPRRREIAPRRVAWLASEVREWIQSRKQLA